MPYTKISSTTTLTSSVTTVDCQKQVRSWRLLRSILELLIPSCNCVFVKENELQDKKCCDYSYCYYRQPSFFSNTTISGTVFGHRRGKVSFCIQENPKSIPMLLLELAISTSTLARKMRGGFVRIALECNTCGNGTGSSDLLSMPVWSMFCNGREVGFAVKKNPSKVDMEVLQLMESVVVGAGTLRRGELKSEDDIMYLRGKFQRVQASSNSESFHLIDPDGNVGQEFSFFFLRSH
ncbi:unnamed protein product [Coffea canephora]|uniref:Protein MIZU-KUSSEI 1-like n=1 Tax=Coffea canephora TaxID=49390 RepID=A0A068TZ00_COFCA|nr:unnamed protein product [Coffea canephora]